jgi:hypothetical protein
MTRWLNFLQKHCYGRPLQPDDYIFPAIGSNGTLQPHTQMSEAAAQLLIAKYTHAAGISLRFSSFTTHCFRRGGAQYRFMFAPIGRRWTLAAVKWWGGWAEGEHVCLTCVLSPNLLSFFTAQHSHALPA